MTRARRRFSSDYPPFAIKVKLLFGWWLISLHQGIHLGLMKREARGEPRSQTQMPRIEDEMLVEWKITILITL